MWSHQSCSFRILLVFDHFYDCSYAFISVFTWILALFVQYGNGIIWLFHILYDSFIILHYITRNLTYLLYILSIIFTIPFVLSLYFNLIFYIFTCYPDFYILFSLLYDSFLWISVLSFSRHPFIWFFLRYQRIHLFDRVGGGD